MIAVTRDDKPLQPPASLDVIVNNAGYTLAGPFEELDDAGAAAPTSAPTGRVGYPAAPPSPMTSPCTTH
ncbi:hypothetical protein [Streptomyces sp. DHE17-7]|uniref:hypothetical protein n=1 Tax=Streptomyces sp. DHE17-7 TaxID=2759949 RepID=UPI0022EB8C05|nr:hypothetical protein [Streptomyces sp. DHE17-7]MBJ6623389.1 hypothetical protein [Streptomyces sp. DHE17-7]